MALRDMQCRWICFLESWLLVEDEPLIALDVEHDLRTAGARVIAAGYLDAALSMTEHPDLWERSSIYGWALTAPCLSASASPTENSHSSFTPAMPLTQLRESGPQFRSFRSPLGHTRSPPLSCGLFPPTTIDEKPVPGSATRTAIIVWGLFRDGSQPQQ